MYTKMSTEIPTTVEAFCANDPEDPHEDSFLHTPTRVLTGSLTVLTNMYTKVCLVSFHMSYFHMFCFLPIRVGFDF